MQVLQIVKEKAKMRQNMNFFETTIYEKYDLRDKIKPGQKFVVRQGDLIIVNYDIENPQKRGLRFARIIADRENGSVIEYFRNSHVILSGEGFTSIFHPEHGLVILPVTRDDLTFYTIDNSKD
ncbi:hypothetical protein [Deltalipothrixvirus pozzuoliense]|uniref:Uncharacterized protein ORF122 n=1 Tax=Acidianus filamentous virus 2 (isolate Italy/Pozzuoli) TaxID=654910 RepID=Y122_AFV2P|nr:hypothetical protein AFV2_gp03 [Acidianus filamentous virus 2]Q573G6.1 RecName: Full=Uncharacterized protein ORF122 [Acidianus filamentous virus 2 (isolate Pozzuoli)]CAH69390.1 hypothetical protein [Acidianus filamentous virus 2]